MISHWPIRYKLLLGASLLLVILAVLSFGGFYGAYTYRGLVKSLSQRSTELPLATQLGYHVSNARATLNQARGMQGYLTEAGLPVDLENWPDDLQPGLGRGALTKSSPGSKRPEKLHSGLVDGPLLQFEFHNQVEEIKRTVQRYRQTLDNNERQELPIGDTRAERETLGRIDEGVERIRAVDKNEAWINYTLDADRLDGELRVLQQLSAELPSHLQRRFQTLSGEVRTQYRGLILLNYVTTIVAVGLLALLVKLLWDWIFRPLALLVRGSRRVAAGDFDHRIELATHDEMAELAGSMNGMIQQFQTVRDDLDRQVQERTKQVVRSEQLASLGFLAAGVSHEINNPLASIAMCAESLESRVHEIFKDDDDDNHRVVSSYLKMIQDEAFRCKEITERLLDFARIGDVEHHNTELRELVQGVIDMVQHLGKYQDKQVEMVPGKTVVAAVNAQEIKQVVLNLVTNALDSVDPGGKVTIEVYEKNGQAEIVFTDNGCGMTEEVMEHLFEPFFTRRRSGQGTGLGLSIVYCIVRDHDGEIVARSDGPDQGSQFRVSLPTTSRKGKDARANPDKEVRHQYQAA